MLIERVKSETKLNVLIGVHFPAVILASSYSKDWFSKTPLLSLKDATLPSPFYLGTCSLSLKNFYVVKLVLNAEIYLICVCEYVIK
jgi:hypothetical protein